MREQAPHDEWHAKPIADAGIEPGDRFLLPGVCRVGPCRRARIDVYPTLQSDGLTDRAARRGAGAARLGRPSANGSPDGSSWRPPRLYRAAVVFCSRGIRGAIYEQLLLAARRRVPHRHGRIVIRGRRRVRLPMDAACTAGDRTGRVRARHHGPIAGGVWRTSGRVATRVASGLSADGRAASGVGGRLRPSRAQSRCPCRSRDVGANDGARQGAKGLAARGVLFPDFWWIRRILDLPPHTAARAVRTDSR